MAGLHLQFGADAATEVVVSWHTPARVSKPRVILGTPDDGLGHEVTAETITYRDAASGTEVYVHHARITGLCPDTQYVYAAVHDGATPELGTVRTAPRGRAALRFTSFGDQSTPTLDASVATRIRHATIADRLPRATSPMPSNTLHLCSTWSTETSATRTCPGTASRTWSDWFENNSRSARYRPWMPAAGNHENELGNGPIGYRAFQTYFAVPDSGAEPELRGLWYAFTAGSVRVISLANDDICYQDGGNSYVRGYSGWCPKALARK